MFDIYNTIKELVSNLEFVVNEEKDKKENKNSYDNKTVNDESSKKIDQLREAKALFPDCVNKHSDEELLAAFRYYREGYINSEFIGYEHIYICKKAVNAKILRKVFKILPEEKNRIEKIIANELIEAKSFFVNSLNHSDDELLDGYMHYKLSNTGDSFVPPDIFKSIEELKTVIGLLPEEEFLIRNQISENIYYGVALKKPSCNADDKKFMDYLMENLKYAETVKNTQKIVDAKRRIADAYANAGKPDKAIEICKEALELLPNDENNYLTLAYFYRLAKKYNESLRIYNDILSKMPLELDYEKAEQRKHIIRIISEIKQEQRN